MEEARTANAAFRVRLAHNHESTLTELIEEKALARNRMRMMEEDIRQQNLRVQMERDEQHFANEGRLAANEHADLAEGRLAELEQRCADMTQRLLDIDHINQHLTDAIQGDFARIANANPELRNYYQTFLHCRDAIWRRCNGAARAVRRRTAPQL